MGSREHVHYGQVRIPSIYLTIVQKHRRGGGGRYIWLMIYEERAFKKTVGCTKTNDLRNLGIFYVKSDISGSTTRENLEEKTYNDRRISRLDEGEEGSELLLVTFHGLETAKKKKSVSGRNTI
jgi:hypothetical protein